MNAAQRKAGPTLPVVGRVLDQRFELLEILGTGGMGRVYRAYDRRHDQEVALKLIRPRHLGRPEREVRFFQEVTLGRRAGAHPHLFAHLDYGRLRDRAWPFITMVLLSGHHLAGRLVEGPIPPAEALRLAQQVAQAVAFLHRHGIVHRDVTPMNVLVCDGDAVLIDLSHASPSTEPGVPRRRRLTRENEVPGTRCYMSPEQARAEPAHAAMDVYGFGVVLHHMLVGGLPTGWARRPRGDRQGRHRLPPPPIDPRRHPHVPFASAALVRACVSPEPGRRPSMDDVVRRLDQQRAALVTVDEPSTADGVPSSAQTTVVTRRRRWGVMVAMTLAVFLVGLLWADQEPALGEPHADEHHDSRPARAIDR